MVNRSRRDPHKNFNFLVMFSAVVGGVAALGIFRKMFARAEYRAPGVYVDEVSSGARPIEGVGTSTAGFVGSTPKNKSRRRTRAGRER